CSVAANVMAGEAGHREGSEFRRGDDLDRGQRYVLHHAAVAGRYLRDLVDNVHAANHLAEHGIAEIAGAVVEEVVVPMIDEELAGRRVDVLRAGHGDGAAYVVQA